MVRLQLSRSTRAHLGQSLNHLANYYVLCSRETLHAITASNGALTSGLPRGSASLAELGRNDSLRQALNRTGLRLFLVNDTWPLIAAAGSILQAADRITVWHAGRRETLTLTAVEPIVFAGETTAQALELSQLDLCGMVVGTTPAMLAALETLKLAAAANSRVVITGESGTGKELAARFIHNNSHRAAQPFVAVNCAAIPEGLILSELFGHERGAFTGAVVSKHGMFEIANGGTIFLDEIVNLSPQAQAAVLRVLQEGVFRRVGQGQEQTTDVRVIAATNKDLALEVRAGRFREDLYYRINVIPIHLPPLRARHKQDLLLLANHFLALHCQRAGKALSGFSPEAQTALLAQPWRGNIRELQNSVERAVALARGPVIQTGDLGLNPPAVALQAQLLDVLAADILDQGLGFHEIRDRLIKAMIEEALRRTQGNVSQAAKLLHMSRDTFRYRIRTLGVDYQALRTSRAAPSSL